ncbi:uncharacterized, partial [Tachysurus ichikawai]
LCFSSARALITVSARDIPGISANLTGLHAPFARDTLGNIAPRICDARARRAGVGLFQTQLFFEGFDPPEFSQC